MIKIVGKKRKKIVEATGTNIYIPYEDKDRILPLHIPII